MFDEQLRGFVLPDFLQSIDLENRLASVPATAFVKGVLLRAAINAAIAATGNAPTDERIRALTSYPVAEILPLMLKCARLSFPEGTDREALRRVGHLVFPAIREHAAATFLFSVAGNNSIAAVKLAGRAFGMFSSAKAAVRVLDPEVTIVELRGAWVFPSCYSVGVFEGAMRHYGKVGVVKVIEHSMCDVDFLLDIRT